MTTTTTTEIFTGPALRLLLVTLDREHKLLKAAMAENLRARRGVSEILRSMDNRVLRAGHVEKPRKHRHVRRDVSAASS